MTQYRMSTKIPVVEFHQFTKSSRRRENQISATSRLKLIFLSLSFRINLHKHDCYRCTSSGVSSSSSLQSSKVTSGCVDFVKLERSSQSSVVKGIDLILNPAGGGSTPPVLETLLFFSNNCFDLFGRFGNATWLVLVKQTSKNKNKHQRNRIWGGWWGAG